MCQLVIVIVMITIYAISNSVVMITVTHVITTTLMYSRKLSRYLAFAVSMVILIIVNFLNPQNLDNTLEKCRFAKLNA